MYACLLKVTNNIIQGAECYSILFCHKILMYMCVYTHIYITSAAISFRNIDSVLISFIPDTEVVTVVFVIFEN